MRGAGIEFLPRDNDPLCLLVAMPDGARDKPTPREV